MATQQDPTEAVRAVFAGFQTAFKAQDVDKIMAAYSDDYSNPEGTDKSALRVYFEGLAAAGGLQNTIVGAEECKIVIDHDSATADPVTYDSPRDPSSLAHNRSSFSYRMEKEADGWRIVSSEPSDLVPAGNWNMLESFSVVMVAAAKRLGLQTDYDTVQAISGNPFAPAIHPEEPATHAWTWSNGVTLQKAAGLETICRAIGMKATPLRRTHEIENQVGDSMTTSASIVREAMNDGSVVICPGEWVADGPHGFVGWSLWGILTEAREDGTILGACMNGFNDNPIAKTCYGGMAWALQPASITLSDGELLQHVLTSALHRIRGDAEPFERTNAHAFGLDAMGVWIEQMRTVPFDPDNPSETHYGAINTAWQTYDGARIVSAFLREYPSNPQVRSMLSDVAECYARIHELLHPALTGEGGETYEQFMDDLTRQEAHANQVLRPVATQLEKAAQTIEMVPAKLEER